VTPRVCPRRGRGWLLAEGYARHSGDAVRLVAGCVVLLLTTLAIHKDYLGSRETAVFRLVNGLALPGWTWPGVWLVMQLGVIGAVPLVAVVALATRHLRLALDAALAAGSIYLIAKVIKLFVQRGRPDSLLDEVNILGEPAGGLGYVSGHSAVAVALATVSSPYLGRRARRVAWALAAAVCLTRMYVGAHLPFDVLGGAALGWAAGALVHLLIGAPESRPPVGRIREALRVHGIEVCELLPVQPQARRSTCLVSGDSSGPGVFVKVVVPEWRDTDLLYRTWRRLRRAGRPVRQGLPVHEAEHEALMGLLARAVGVRVPRVLLVTSFGNGAGLLVQEWIDGRTLAELDSDRIDDDLLADLRRQVAALHRGGLAHQDLSGDNIMIDRDGMTWLVDFDQAVAGADRGCTASDERAVETTLADLAGPRRSQRPQGPARHRPPADASARAPTGVLTRNPCRGQTPAAAAPQGSGPRTAPSDQNSVHQPTYCS
jgi:membrane-associated phospholipid phosphatase